VIENYQHIGLFVEGNQNFSKPRIAGICSVIGQSGHPLIGAGTGKVVDAQVEGLGAIGCGPLYGDGDLAGAGDGAQKHGGLDVVVVGDGDHGGQAQLLNLAGFQVERQFGGGRGCPIALSVVDADAVLGLGTVLEAGEERTDDGILIAQVGQEVERFMGLVGVAVERDSRTEISRSRLVAP
jgi:hypothetical protein